MSNVFMIVGLELRNIVSKIFLYYIDSKDTANERKKEK